MVCNLLSAKHSRSLVWWEITIWKAIRVTLNGPVIPFGALVEYHSISAMDMSRSRQFGPKVLPGIIPRLCIVCGRNLERRHCDRRDLRIWRRWDASEIHARRFNAKEVLTPVKGDNFISHEWWNVEIPNRRWNSQTPGRDRRLKPSTLIRNHPERGEEQEVFRGESDGLSSRRCGGQWCLLVFYGRFHLSPSRGTRWSTSMLPEKHRHYWIMLTYWWLLEGAWRKRIIWCMDRLHKNHFIERKAVWMDTHGRWRDWRGNKRPPCPTMDGQKCGSICLMQRKGNRSESGLSRNQNSIMPENYVVSSSLNQMMKKMLVEILDIPMPAGMPCQTPTNCRGESCRIIGKHKTKYACIVDAD